MGATCGALKVAQAWNDKAAASPPSEKAKVDSIYEVTQFLVGWIGGRRHCPPGQRGDNGRWEWAQARFAGSTVSRRVCRVVVGRKDVSQAGKR